MCIFVSSRVNSKNIIKWIKTAKKTISITGFNSSLAKKLTDISLHIKTSTYEHHEHLAKIMMYYLYLKLKMKYRLNAI